MPYKIPLGTEIFPHDSKSGQTGISQLTTVEIEFGQSDVLDTVSITDPANGQPVECIRLALGENPTHYDSYLVRVGSVVET